MDYLIGLVVIIGAIYYCSLFVQPYTEVVIMNRFTGGLRPVEPGWHFLGPWEAIVRAEKEGSSVDLKKKMHTFKAIFETQDESPVELEVSFDYVAHGAVAYRAFEDATRLAGIQARLTSILTILVRKKDGRDEVLDSLEGLQSETKKVFENTASEDGKLLQDYFGVNLTALVIRHPELPQKLRDAQVEREAVEKKNESRQLEMKKLKQMASDLVKESERRGSKVSYEKALDFVQLQFNSGNIKKNIQVLDLGPGVKSTLEEALKAVLNREKGV